MPQVFEILMQVGTGSDRKLICIKGPPACEIQFAGRTEQYFIFIQGRKTPGIVRRLPEAENNLEAGAEAFLISLLYGCFELFPFV